MHRTGNSMSTDWGTSDDNVPHTAYRGRSEDHDKMSDMFGPMDSRSLVGYCVRRSNPTDRNCERCRDDDNFDHRKPLPIHRTVHPTVYSHANPTKRKYVLLPPQRSDMFSRFEGTSYNACMQRASTIGYATPATPATFSKGRLIRCTVPGSTPDFW